jgi:hypothetical protein
LKNVWGVNIGRASIGFAVGLIAYVVIVRILACKPDKIKDK